MIKKTLLTIGLFSALASPLFVIAATTTSSPLIPLTTIPLTTTTPTLITPKTTDPAPTTPTSTTTTSTLDPNAASNFSTWFNNQPTTTVDPVVTSTVPSAPTNGTTATPSTTQNPNGTTITPTTTVPPRTNTTTIPPRTNSIPPRTTTPRDNGNTQTPPSRDPITPPVIQENPPEINCPSVTNPLESVPCPKSSTIIPFISPLVIGGSAAGLIIFWLVFSLFNRFQNQSLDSSLAKRASLQTQNRNDENRQQNQIDFLEKASSSLSGNSPEQQKELQKIISLMEINGNDQAQVNTAKNVLSALDNKDSKTAQKLLSELTFLFKH